jgi:hypothetical protein
MNRPYVTAGHAAPQKSNLQVNRRTFFAATLTAALSAESPSPIIDPHNPLLRSIETARRWVIRDKNAHMGKDK